MTTLRLSPEEILALKAEHWNEHSDMARLIASYESALTRIDRLEGALRRYGQHERTCYALVELGPCHCGFSEVLKEEP